VDHDVRSSIAGVTSREVRRNVADMRTNLLLVVLPERAG
jgi:hypothetical protein